MIDFRQLGSWLIVFALFVAIPFFVTYRPFLRRALGDWLSRLGAWAMDQLEPASEYDQLADDLYTFRRRERLHSDIQRLQRIIATDMSMSATRQLGNRLAYDWLLRELETSREPSQPFVATGAVNSWNSPVRPVHPAGPDSGRGSQRAPNVEILEIGWRR